MNENIKKIIHTFFEKLGAHIDNIEISEDEKNIYTIKIKSDDSGMLIGPHGKNLNNIQGVIKLMISKNLGEKIKLHLEVNDYMEAKDKKLFSFINSKINFVEKSSKDVQLPFYTAYDRKKIHSFVAEHGNEKIYTKSIGEGRERRLYICKKDVKLTIDIDGEDI